MASLYNIEQELINLFTTIEDNDGEVTEEQYESLCIKQEELKTKLEKYYQAIRLWESNADCCKNEKKRINDVQNKYKNRIERLKSAMLDAVKAFGEHGKSNMFIELPTVRLSTRNSKAIEVNEDRIRILANTFQSYIEELWRNGIIEQNNDPDLQGLLEVLNANICAEQGEDFEPFSIADLMSINFDIKTNLTVYDMFKNHTKLLQDVGENNFMYTIENNTSKDEWKRNLILATAQKARITVAEEVNNVSLQIK